MQYFAQDEATRLDPALSVYETMSADSPTNMVPAIRNILGGFLFSGDDIYKKAGVLSGGERTRLAVARMLLHPVEHAAARRADEPSRSRLEGHPARSARRLRRHADLRLARSVLRREARDQDRGDRPRGGDRVSRAPTRSFCAARSNRTGATGATGASGCEARSRRRTGSSRRSATARRRARAGGGAPASPEKR